MGKKGSLKITSLLVVLSLLVAILPVYSFDRPEEYIEEISDQCIGFKTFGIDANNVDYAILEVKGEGVQTYEDSAIKQENAEGSRTSGTQTFTCKGEITGIDVYILPPAVYTDTQSSVSGVPWFATTLFVTPLMNPMMPGPLPTIEPPIKPSTINLTLYLKDLGNNILFQSQTKVSAIGKPFWISFTVPNLNLNGKYKLQLTGVSWYYGSGYPNGSADFNANKDFCFRIHYKKEKTVYPKEVKYKTNLMDSYETISTNLQNGTKRITIPKENIDGATELSLSSQNGNVLTKISWNLKVFHKVPETPAKLSLPFVTIEGNNTTFQIRYTDMNNDPPLSAKIYINDVEYDLVNNDDDSYQWNGSLYSITLPYQECNYYFIFDNGKETIRMPEEDSFYIGELEKKLSEWKENIEEESILIDRELEMVDQYYIQENQSLGLLNDMIENKIELIKKSAWNHRYMLDIYQLASEREEIQAFENLSNEEIVDAINDIKTGFPEEIKEIFRGYGMSEGDIEQLRTDILNNKDTISEKRILSNFIDLKDVYKDMGLLHIESASFTFNIYTREGKFTPVTDSTVATAKNSVKASWQNVDIQSIDTMEIEGILENSKYLVEKGYPEYVDDFYAALVYLYLSIAGDDAFTQELYNNSSIYAASPQCPECEEETTWQETFDFASTVRYYTINDIQPIMIIESPEEDPIVIEIPYIPPKQISVPTSIVTPDCGNGKCEPELGETCHNCVKDCGFCCGDGTCASDENCETCPADCGPCDPDPTPPGDPCEGVTCPGDGYVGEKYCKNGDVYQKYRDYYCENGECKYTETETKIKDCEGGCENGGCIVNPCGEDKDGDGVGENCDECPGVKGKVEYNGCRCPGVPDDYGYDDCKYYEGSINFQEQKIDECKKAIDLYEEWKEETKKWKEKADLEGDCSTLAAIIFTKILWEATPAFLIGALLMDEVEEYIDEDIDKIDRKIDKLKEIRDNYEEKRLEYLINAGDCGCS